MTPRWALLLLLGAANSYDGTDSFFTAPLEQLAQRVVLEAGQWESWPEATAPKSR